MADYNKLAGVLSGQQGGVLSQYMGAPQTYAQGALNFLRNIPNALFSLGQGQAYGTADPNNPVSDLERARFWRGSVMGAPEELQQRNYERALAIALNAPAIGMIKSPTGRIPENISDVNYLAKLLGKNAPQAQIDEAATGSKYFSFENPIPDQLPLTVRIANHKANPSNNLGRQTFSVDPSDSGNTFEDAIRWLDTKGIALPRLTANANKQEAQRIAAESLKMEQELAKKVARNQLIQNAASNSYKGVLFSSTKINSGGRRYDLTDTNGIIRSFYSTDIPDAVKTGPRENLIDYLLGEMKNP